MADPEFFSLDPESPDYDPELLDMVSIGRAIQCTEDQEDRGDDPR